MPAIHKTRTEWNQDMQFTSHINNHSFIVDTVPAGGGKDSGPSPKPFLLTSLAGCTGMDVVSFLKKMRVNFSDFSIDVDANLRDEHPRIYTEINVIYKIKLAETDQPKMEKAVTLSMEQYCGVSAMLSKICPIHSKIEYLK